MEGFSKQHAEAVKLILAEKWRQRFGGSPTEVWNLSESVRAELAAEIDALVETTAADDGKEESA